MLLLVVVVSVVVVLFNGADMRVPDFLQDHSLSRRLVLYRTAAHTAQHNKSKSTHCLRPKSDATGWQWCDWLAVCPIYARTT